MKNIKVLRQKNNLSQQNLADILHISQQSIWKYENDITTPDLETLTKMADYFNTSVDYLIGYTDIPNKIEIVTDTMLNDDELHLIEYYRKLSQQQKDAVRTVVKSYNL